MSAPRRPRGFTLVEIMVALVIVAVVFGQILAVFSSQQQAYLSHERVTDTQQDARLVTELILHDIRMAGFMVPAEAGIASRDGGGGGADVFCTSDPNVIAPVQIFAATGPFDRASLQSALGAAASGVTLAPGDLDVDGDGDVDFAIGGGLVLSDGNDSHCARITAVNAATGQVQFTPATPAGFAIGTASGRAAPALIYEITGSGLTRNAMLVSSHVEDLQIEFGVDADGDGQIGAGEFPIHDLHGTGSDPSRVRQVRVTVTSRASDPDALGASVGLAAAANRTAGAADGFRRRRITAMAIPRNLL